MGVVYWEWCIGSGVLCCSLKDVCVCVCGWGLWQPRSAHHCVCSSGSWSFNEIS